MSELRPNALQYEITPMQTRFIKLSTPNNKLTRHADALLSSRGLLPNRGVGRS
jgi:hypothetical protein